MSQDHELNLETICFRFGGVGDNQSVSSYRTDILPPSGDEISLRSLPAAVHQQQSLANPNQLQQHHQVGWMCEKQISEGLTLMIDERG